MRYNHPEPTADRRAALAVFIEGLTGKEVRPTQRAWVRDVLLVHGPGAEAALERGYREGGWDNLFIRVVDVSVSSAAEGPRAVPDEEVAAVDSRRPPDVEPGQLEVTPEPGGGASLIFPNGSSEFDLPNAPLAPAGSDGLWDCYPGLLYGPNDRPPFDPESKIRWDDRGSNPDRADLGARHEDLVRRAQR